MTEVLLLGQPLWAGHVADVLNTGSPDVRATHIPQSRYARLIAQPTPPGRVVIMRAGYRIGSSTLRGRLFDAYWSLLRRRMPRAVACHYWLGSDVMDTLAEARKGTLRTKALVSSRADLHLAGAPWLIPELAEVGIDAVLAFMPARTRAPVAVAPIPATFRVLTYVPADRFEFYGGPTIVEVARRLPDVAFDVVGNDGARVDAPPANITWHGWVDDMPTRYAAATVIVRIPRHDGGAGTMSEGLLHGRYVIYIHAFPFVRQVNPVSTETVVAAIQEYSAAHAEGRLAPNLAGRDHALETFNEARLVEHMKTLLRADP